MTPESRLEVTESGQRAHTAYRKLDLVVRASVSTYDSGIVIGCGVDVVRDPGWEQDL